MNVRVACAQAIASILRGEASLNTQIPLYTREIPARDANLLKELCYGTLRHFFALDLILKQLLDKPLKSKEAEVSALLLSALYQLREMRTPSHAAVNEAVAALKPLKKTWAKGLVNGVLRSYLRRQAEIEENVATKPVFRHMHSPWLARQFEQDWPDKAEDIMAANNQRPPMCLRVNTGKLSRADYLARLSEAGLNAHPAQLSPVGIYLESPVVVDALPGFAEGLVSVQDEAAQLCAGLLDLQSGQRVLDACAAPGGKTCHLLETDSSLEVTALDVDGSRLAKVGENLDRLGLGAELKAADATDTAAWWDGKPFDRILLDAPCSATGVIRRHPDIKLLRKASDIVKLNQLQGELLDALWRTLKPGGKLLYATCSVITAENSGVVTNFASSRKDCTILPLDVPWGVAGPAGRQLFPQDQGHDGFYYALLLKDT